MYSGGHNPCGLGYPIRRFQSQSLFPARLNLSQSITSFIASVNLGIRHALLFYCDYIRLQRAELSQPEGHLNFLAPRAYLVAAHWPESHRVCLLEHAHCSYLQPHAASIGVYIYRLLIKLSEARSTAVFGGCLITCGGRDIGQPRGAVNTFHATFSIFLTPPRQRPVAPLEKQGKSRLSRPPATLYFYPLS
jgi:hypothetical protein